MAAKPTSIISATAPIAAASASATESALLSLIALAGTSNSSGFEHLFSAFADA
jgi:hypothetical protein